MRVRPDLRVLVALIALVTLAYGFVELADAVSEPETASVDEQILFALRANADGTDPIGPRRLEKIIVNLSAFGSDAITTVVALAVIGYLLLDGRPRLALLVFVAVVGGWAWMFLIKDLVGRERPTIVEPLVEASGLSFPSGHALMSATLYGTLAVLLSRAVSRARLRIYLISVALTLALLVGFTRVYMGVHHPTDVLAGWMLGLGWALFCGLVAHFLQRRRLVERAPPPAA